MSASTAKIGRPLQILALGVMVWGVGRLANHFLPGNLLGALEDLALLLLLGVGAYYSVVLLVSLIRRALWKVRNKLILSFAFVGGIPVLLLLALLVFVTSLIFKPLSGFYVQREIEVTTRTVSSLTDHAVTAYLRSPVRDRTRLEEYLATAARDVPLGMQRLTFFLYEKSDSGIWKPVSRIPGNSPVDAPSELPDWIEDGYSGIVLRGDQLHFVHAVDFSQGARIVSDLPFDEAVLNYLRRRTSVQLALTPVTATTEPAQFTDLLSEIAQSDRTPSVRWVHFFTPAAWSDGRSAEPWALALNVPVDTLVEYFFAQDAGPLFIVIGILAGAFIIVELVSLAVGIGIARSITNTIHALDNAVQRIREGDFSVRIPTRGRDQLEAVGESFNQMCSSITQLMEEVGRREWIAKELEIAREVQSLLFPHGLPELPGLQLAASCRPARQVSGDYYDFLVYGRHHLDIVVGDIAGKGISAALLMASLQSSIRSALGEYGMEQDPCVRLTRVVARVNRHLYQCSAPEAYSTLVIAHLNLADNRLCYCNAGHHPPLLFTDNRRIPLVPGGTVVGLFEDTTYEARSVCFGPEDLAVFFTDGLLEAANKHGEEFGVERLAQLIQTNAFLTSEDLHALVLSELEKWTGSCEHDDDVTLVIIKREKSNDRQEAGAG